MALDRHRGAIRSRAEQIKSRRLDNNLKRTYRMLVRSKLFKFPKHKRSECQATSPQEQKLNVLLVKLNGLEFLNASQAEQSRKYKVLSTKTKIPCNLVDLDNNIGYSSIIEALIKLLEYRLTECPDKQQKRLWEARIHRMFQILEK